MKILANTMTRLRGRLTTIIHLADKSFLHLKNKGKMILLKSFVFYLKSHKNSVAILKNALYHANAFQVLSFYKH